MCESLLRRIGIGVMFALTAYLVGALGGGYLLSLLSSNQHDKEMEAAITGAFVFGPLAAIVGFVIGVVLMRDMMA
jgi:hypothetical protein